MKNKQVKQMIFRDLAIKFDCEVGDFWFDDGRLMQYHPPCGFMEGDELPVWHHWVEYPYVSLTADQHRAIK